MSFKADTLILNEPVKKVMDPFMIEYQRVDRHKLEQMIAMLGRKGCQRVFADIMERTQALLQLPHKLKFDTRNRRNPAVRIVGDKRSIIAARNIIRAIFEDRTSHVVLQMSVSHTEHAFIIGPDCATVHSIVTETYTNMQFPNWQDKSNAVTISGCLDQVEHARALLRLQSPLAIIFEMQPGHQPEQHEADYIRLLEQSCSVRIIMLEDTLQQLCRVVVRGSEQDAEQVRTAAQLLMNLFAGKLPGGELLVKLRMEVSRDHHAIVKGYNNQTVLGIMQRTQTHILFPNLAIDPYGTQVEICGHIDGVYLARQLLIGNLPIMLRFDLHAHHRQIGQQELMELNIKYGVYAIILRNERQQHVIINGLEKYLHNIYEARREILRLDYSGVLSEVPDNYFLGVHDKYPDYGVRHQMTALLAGYEANSALLGHAIPAPPGFFQLLPVAWPPVAAHHVNQPPHAAYMDCGCANHQPINMEHYLQFYYQQLALHQQQLQNMNRGL